METQAHCKTFAQKTSNTIFFKRFLLLSPKSLWQHEKPATIILQHRARLWKNIKKRIETKSDTHTQLDAQGCRLASDLNYAKTKTMRVLKNKKY